MQCCAHPAAEGESLFAAVDYISGEKFSVARCRACGQIVTVPVPTDLGKYYPAGYYGDAHGRRFPAVMEWIQNQLYVWRAHQLLRRFQRPQPKVLDIGCGRGHLLRAFQRAGGEVLGTEFSDDACRFAREVLKLPVRVGTLAELNFPAESFDIIVMWHVLEHVSDVRPTLAEIARILKPGGFFMVAVPDFGSPEARLTQAGWFHLDVPRHHSHHTRASLAQALRNAGLQPRWSSSLAPEYDSFSFVQSLLNRLGVRQNFLYNLLRGRRAKVVGGGNSFGSLLATGLLAPLFFLLSLPATLLLAICGRGGTIILTAEKQASAPLRKFP
jgi:ubiquinone/menaquinone biosynthesis C-methylase UbiE